MRTNPASDSGTFTMSILWGMIIPQIILIALNIRGWTLISGEANNDEASYAIAMFSFELSIILFAILVFCLHKAGKIQIGWKLSLASLIVHATYLWLLLISIENIVPNSIQPWILNEGNVGRWNITLFMPGAFLSLYALSKSFFSRTSGAKGGLIVLLATVGMPVAWYLLVSIMQPAWFGQASVIVSILIGTVTVVLFLAAMIHFFDSIIHKPTTIALVDKHYIIAVLLGLAAPLGGLALNHEIPFPANFQSIGVYVLTVVNGLILILKPQGARLARARLFLRCLVFPFILYFFLVFLPFLPLSLLAILAVGAGFLMLTPLALGLFQTRITLDEYNLVKNKIGKPKTILISILGMSVLPVYFLVQAAVDKNALDTSLEYFYSHDTSAKPLSELEISRATNALVQLRDRKADIQLPYISGIYNAVVFGDLVLSDKKISRMYNLLTGVALPDEKMSLFGARDNSRRGFRGRGLVAPKQEVKISSMEIVEVSKGESIVKLLLKNSSSGTHSLFVSQFDLPEGVFISGLRLKIEDEWVAGRIFDRKTALWVFQKITEVRRDPALLYYLSSNLTELRVYPFPSLGVREVEIDFQYHPEMDSQIIIGDRQIDLNPSVNFPSILSRSGITLVRDRIPQYAFQRNPYIHFILDYSGATDTNSTEYAVRILEVIKELKITKFRISAANIGVSKTDAETLLETSDLESITKKIESIKLPRAGGLWIEQAIAKEILQIKHMMNLETFNRTPIFVVISDKVFEPDKLMNLDPWSWLIPDMQGWYSFTKNELHWQKLDGKRHDIKVSNAFSNSVIAIARDSEISIFPADDSSIYKSGLDKELRIYNPFDNKFSPLDLNIEDVQHLSKWTGHAKLWSDWRLMNLNPSEIETERLSFLERSRTQNVLLPLTSLIVVESPSQWEILKRKEKQSLSNHSGLDFEEEQQTPEPPWWLLLAGLLIYLYFREKNVGLPDRLARSKHVI